MSHGGLCEPTHDAVESDAGLCTEGASVLRAAPQPHFRGGNELGNRRRTSRTPADDGNFHARLVQFSTRHARACRSIHVSLQRLSEEDVDGRNKSGHDSE